MRAWTAVPALFLCLCAPAGAARADLYQWVDATGRVHFTDDPTRVPRDQRVAAKREQPVDSDSRSWNTVEIAPPSSLPSYASPANASSSKTGRKHVLAVQRAASEIRLTVTLDDRADAVFIADTGASLNTIPSGVAERLGLEFDAETPTISLVGVGGRAMKAPLVRLDSVRVGSAVVRDVEFAVLDTMSTGLLGMPFFNHFKVEIDPTRGTLTLTEVDLDAIEGIYGGMDEASWRQRYAQIRRQQEAIADLRENIPSEFETIAESRLMALEEEEARLERQLDRLDEQAGRAGVPGNWRE